MNAAGHVELADVERAAALVFRRQSYRGATMQEVADEVGLHKASLYHHIKSKQSVLVSIAKTAINNSLLELESICRDEDLEPVQKLWQAVHMQVTEITKHPDQIAVFTMYLNEISDDKMREEFIARRKRYEDLYLQIVADCLGVQTTSADAKLTSLAILGMCNWTLNWYHPGGSIKPAALAAKFADMATRAISTADINGAALSAVR